MGGPFGPDGRAGPTMQSPEEGGQRLRWMCFLRGEAEMNTWWWVPIGLGAWLALAVVVGLLLGPVLRYCSQAWEAWDAYPEDMPARSDGPPRRCQHAA
jgi:hypothetical protein